MDMARSTSYRELVMEPNYWGTLQGTTWDNPVCLILAVTRIPVTANS